MLFLFDLIHLPQITKKKQDVHKELRQIEKCGEGTQIIETILWIIRFWVTPSSFK